MCTCVCVCLLYEVLYLQYRLPTVTSEIILRSSSRYAIYCNSACCACIMVLKDLCSNGIFFMHLDFIDLTQDSDDVTSLSPVSLSSSDELPAENGQSSR